MFFVKKYDQGLKKNWDEFVATAKNSTFLFYRDFMDYHADRFVDHSLIIYKEQKIIALFIANEIDDCIYSHSGLTYGGLLTSSKTYTSDFLLAFKEVLKYYANNHFVEVKIKTLPYIFTEQAADEIDYLAFICKANLYRRDIHSVINYSNFYKESKSVLRDFKSVSHKFIFKQDNNLEAFWETLLIPNLYEVHKSIPVHSLNEIKKLQKLFPNQIKFFGCYCEEVLMGGVLIFETSFVAHCQYISGTKEFNKKLGLIFLLYNVIKHYSEQKRYFNFGISNTNMGQNLNKGLLLWKEKFGARAVSQSFYNFNPKLYYLIDQILV